jgi:predicted nucleotide-binding protein (sugar kinase/HSP70/actin superfamily)
MGTNEPTARLVVKEAVGVRIGIPRGLLFARYGAAWQALLGTLGIEAVVSPPTNRAILDAGCRLAVDETCLSVKSYLGHVAWLAERTDAVLVPRVVAARRSERECVKLWGIQDIARNALPDVRIVGYSVDASGMTHRRVGTIGGLYGLARDLGASPVRASYATTAACAALARERAAALVAFARVGRAGGDAPRVLVVGHGYNLHDQMIGAPIVRTLQDLGCRVLDSEAVPGPLARHLGSKASPTLAWTNNRRLLGAVHHLHERVDGILFVVTFPCGPDSLVTELALRTVPGVPMITLVLDEHAGEGGLRTRLESFVDLLGMQRDRARKAVA